MKEIKKFNIIDRSLDMEKIIRTNIGLFALQERLKEEEIYVSSFGIIQCIDVYLRTLLLCNEARDRFDMANKADTPLVLKKCTYESIEKFHQNFVNGTCAFSEEEAFNIMVTISDTYVKQSRRFLMKDFNYVINNSSMVFDLVKKYVDDIFALLKQEIDDDTSSVHLDILIGGIGISFSNFKDTVNSYTLRIRSNVFAKEYD